MSNMERKYLIFVPDTDVDEDELEYSEIVNWAYDNLHHSNVMLIDLDDIYKLQYKSEVFDIINNENHGMLQAGEDDWVISSDIKIRIKDKLSNYVKNVQNNDLMSIILRLINLLEISIQTGKNLYFII